VNARRRLAAAALALVVPALSSCGVNFGAQTEQVYNPAAGVDNRSGTVDVLNALIVCGKDGSGTVVATLVNQDQSHADTLRGVAGSGKDASLQVTPGGATTIPAAGMLNLATKGHIFARGSRVTAGNFVQITFTFARAAAITVQVPVVPASDPIYKGIKLPSGG
jgi:hypothetical protein